MSYEMLSRLKVQLKERGIDAPEEMKSEPPEEIPRDCITGISGGFGQQVGFGQVFDQTSGPGTFVQNNFIQNIGFMNEY
jgi:hypothetical protein